MSMELIKGAAERVRLPTAGEMTVFGSSVLIAAGCGASGDSDISPTEGPASVETTAPPAPSYFENFVVCDDSGCLVSVWFDEDGTRHAANGAQSLYECTGPDDGMLRVTVDVHQGGGVALYEGSSICLDGVVTADEIS